MDFVEYCVWGMLMALVVGFFVAAVVKSRVAFGVLALVAILGAGIYPAAVQPAVNPASTKVIKTEPKPKSPPSLLEQTFSGLLGGSK